MMVSFQEKFVSLLSTLFTVYVTAVDGSREQIEKHLEMGRLFLTKGQFSDALSQYHAAVDLDPENYQAHYRRATCYLAMGKSKASIEDLEHVLRLKPDFVSARLQRGNILLKYCDLDNAKQDFETILSKEPGNSEAVSKIAIINPLKSDVKQANELFERGDLHAAERIFSKILEHCPMNAELHEKRAECYEEMGDIQKAINDLRSMAKLVPDSTEAYYKIADFYYRSGDAEQALINIRECLKLSPEHAKCFPFYKVIKKVVKEQEAVTKDINDQKYDKCLEDVQRLLKTEKKVKAIIMQAKENLCHCYSKGGKVADALNTCNEVLAYNPNNVDALCDRAEAYILDEKFENAISDFQEALGKFEDNRRAKEGLDKAQKLLKQSKKKDYYKILGVKRNADKPTIMKAYRQLAQQWHPDNFKPEEKEEAQKKFIDIAAAKEVLTDKEKRRIFDSGEDPLDPEAQQQHANHFHGFNPFGDFGGFPGGGGGGPFQFKFHFQ